jgi:tRNA wybutosine-synthesizing protein 1
MISDKIKNNFKKQGYRLVGKHSAIKICTWTKQSIRDKDVCYKEKFYGINSHRCVQMSCTLLNCQNKCLHCWRDLSFTDNCIIKKPDSPKKIIDDCIKQQWKILQGFKGSEKSDLKKFHESLKPTQFAISLTGEATLYPYLPEMIKELRKRKMNSFLVSNGLLPEKLKELSRKNALPTQLYLSVLYPNESIFRKITNNREKESWKRFNESLKILKSLSKKTRTVLRLTLIKRINMVEPENYATLIKKAEPDFIEIKAYMHVGFSRERLKYENVPSHQEVKNFSRKIMKSLKGYKLIDEKKNSRVILLSNDRKGKLINPR